MKELLRKWYAIYLLLLIVVALLSSLLANNKPLYCKIDNTVYFPAFKEWIWGKTENNIFVNDDWKQKNIQSIIWSPIPYKYFQQNTNETLIQPFTKESISTNHWLGTDHLGRDIFAGLINGTKTALLVGIGSIFLMLFFGFNLGVISGYYGNSLLKFNKIRFFLLLILLLLSIAYLIVFKNQFAIEIIDNHQFMAIIGFLLIIFILSGIIILGTKNRLNKTFVFPVDATILKLIELINTIPKLLLLITIMAIVNRSIWTIIVIIGLLGWTTIAKLTRSETLKIKEMEYITAVKLLGLSDFKIIYKHIFPNIIPPILIYICFGIASSIIAEAGLSFLGLGLPANEVSWGSMLSASREYISSWWLLFFPGLALFLTILSLHKIGEFIRKKYQPQKLQNINSYF